MLRGSPILTHGQLCDAASAVLLAREQATIQSVADVDDSKRVGKQVMLPRLIDLSRRLKLTEKVGDVILSYLNSTYSNRTAWRRPHCSVSYVSYDVFLLCVCRKVGHFHTWWCAK